MARFLDELRRYLGDVESASATPARAARPSIDLPAARQHFIKAAEVFDGADDGPTRLLRDRGELDAFLLQTAFELSTGLCAGSNAETLQQHVHHAVDIFLGLGVFGLSNVRRGELWRVAAYARDAVEAGVGIDDLARYAWEVRALRKGASGTALSDIGKVLMSLPETDAVRWLLTIETLQSMGSTDAFRMPSDALEAILDWPRDAPCRLMVAGDEGVLVVGEAPILWLFSDRVLSRLRSLGVIAGEAERDLWLVSLVPAFRLFLEELVSRRGTPLSMLAESLIAEERGTVWRRAPEPPPSGQSAAEVQGRHARMVVHEIYNALVPVRMAQTAMYRVLEAHVPRTTWQSQKERIDRGIDRVFRFVDELQRVAQLTAVPVEPFDLAAAVHDAITALNGSLAMELDLTVPPVTRLLGDRKRFTLAVVNILRNAAQNATKPRARVRFYAMMVPDGRQVAVTIEDDGPGVPEEHRENIFRQGFALRPGGSGQGLGLVREVVEIEMKGEVRCEEGDLGGARFVLVLPATIREETK